MVAHLFKGICQQRPAGNMFRFSHDHMVEYLCDKSIVTAGKIILGAGNNRVTAPMKSRYRLPASTGGS